MFKFQRTINIKIRLENSKGSNGVRDFEVKSTVCERRGVTETKTLVTMFDSAVRVEFFLLIACRKGKDLMEVLIT